MDAPHVAASLAGAASGSPRSVEQAETMTSSDETSARVVSFMGRRA
ncbi:hypothetical protein DB32_000126 [Sandaracinus amylolyticus]|uniref:Uncharacterized protein n=1 Tax=Sandaracinus amylolyticus TaxID=927083 RepID=A0A0F6YFY3_9BACT|nr:hypothetical protein DB32_000126 [Sandaracinus amylolyticus]